MKYLTVFILFQEIFPQASDISVLRNMWPKISGTQQLNKSANDHDMSLCLFFLLLSFFYHRIEHIQIQYRHIFMHINVVAVLGSNPRPSPQ